ncbi:MULTISPECIES: tetratricopeptide repeat protein [Niastella]|uniref:Tetratricopeptide repeat protein n=1 Tax=Niastella soli TaxID=2821487 RepID=A0ABS3Z527_9BACT|nr:tetratricopeptide repeat protein [Niastella soli]MBO9204760.1 tetratricopeptide repeat protein [Niastella soli]
MTDYSLSKVGILIQQRKYDAAEKILRQLLAQEPTNIYYLGLLSELNLAQAKIEESESIIEDAIGLSPDTAHLYFIKSRVDIHKDKYDDGEKSIQQAISLDPYTADYFAWFANIKLARKQYDESLRLANRSLEIDPEDLLALNVRSTVLIKLNRKEESFATIEGALRNDPNNPYTHANYGWGLLEKGDHKKALKHFKEALKNDPNFDYAQRGMIEALKASNPVYRLFLKYAFWIGNMGAKYQWGILLGLWLGTQALNELASRKTGLQPVLIPVIVLLALFAFSTWIIKPVSNLFLRFNQYGKFLLDKKEKMSSNFVAVSVGVLLTGLVMLAVKGDVRYMFVAAYGLTMMVPLSVMFVPSKYNSILIYTISLAVLGASALATAYAQSPVFDTLVIVYLIAFVAFQVLINFLVIRRNNK